MKFLLIILALFGAFAADISPGYEKPNNLDRDNEAVEFQELVPDDHIKKCKENGDEEAYLRAKLARQKLTQCGSALLHTDKLLQEVRTAALSNGQGMGPIVKKFCKVYQTSGQLCLAEYLDNLVPCLNETQRQIEELVVKMAETSWVYACEQEGFRAIQFFRNHTLSCLEMQSPGLVECIAPYIYRLRIAGDPTRAVAEVLVRKECSLYLDVSQCIVKKLQECPDQTAADIVSGSFYETQRISPCAGHVLEKSEKEELPLQTATFLQVEGAVHKLEEIIRQEHTQHETSRKDILAALEKQTALLKQLTTSFETAIPLIRYGRGSKWSRHHQQ